MEDHNNLGYRLFLAGIDGIGPRTIKKLLEAFPGGAREIWECSDACIKACSLLNEKQAQQLIAVRKQWDPERKLEKIMKKNIKTVTMEENRYPEKLRTIIDPPYLLYYYGELPKDCRPSVAVIGSRTCSDYGRRKAEDFAACLARNGVQVISGLASGIDGIAQKAAVAAGGKSYGILGCGVDICYPGSNRPLYEELKRKGGLISEFEPGEKPEADHFPRRNRIISGLADIVLVVEARERSGTSITVQMALEQGREVFALPGRTVDVLSRGCNLLIRDGAGMAIEPGDLLASLSLMGYERTDGMYAAAGHKDWKEEGDGQTSGKAAGQTEHGNPDAFRTGNRTGKDREASAPEGKNIRTGQAQPTETLRENIGPGKAKPAEALKEKICCLLRQDSYLEQQLFDRLSKEPDAPGDIRALKCALTELEMEDRIVKKGSILEWRF